MVSNGDFLLRQSIELGLKALICRICNDKKCIQEIFERCYHDLSMLLKNYYNVGNEEFLNDAEKSG